MKTLLCSLVATATLALAAPTVCRADDDVTASLQRLKGQEFDQAFLKDMIEHHRHAVEMARLAADRAQNPEVKQFADRTVKEQQDDIETMQSLLTGSPGGAGDDRTVRSAADSMPMGDNAGTGSTRAGPAGTHEITAGTPPAGENKERGKMMEMQTKLESARGSDFDRQFVDLMIRHHEMGVKMAQLAAQRGSRPEVTAFAAKTAKIQQQEIGELQKLKSSNT